MLQDGRAFVRPFFLIAVHLYTLCIIQALSHTHSLSLSVVTTVCGCNLWLISGHWLDSVESTHNVDPKCRQTDYLSIQLSTGKFPLECFQAIWLKSFWIQKALQSLSAEKPFGREREKENRLWMAIQNIVNRKINNRKVNWFPFNQIFVRISFDLGSFWARFRLGLGSV